MKEFMKFAAKVYLIFSLSGFIVGTISGVGARPMIGKSRRIEIVYPWIKFGEHVGKEALGPAVDWLMEVQK